MAVAQVVPIRSAIELAVVVVVLFSMLELLDGYVGRRLLLTCRTVRRLSTGRRIAVSLFLTVFFVTTKRGML